jgi:uracil-DNA glycosylase family 4
MEFPGPGRPGRPSAADLPGLQGEITRCRACPRLVAWREEVARTRRTAYAGEDYWGRPVPGFGDPAARLLVVGLAPAAHGANRTGRMFTGDRSGDWLYRALQRAGFASQPTSRGREDGLVLTDAYVTAAVRCAPPANRPTTAEQGACRPFLEREMELLDRVRVVAALGRLAMDQLWRILKERGEPLPTPRPPFRHGLEVGVRPGLVLLASYHPSQQNTFTGKLTEAMFEAVWRRARARLEG